MGVPMAFQNSIIAMGAITIQFALNNLGEVSVTATLQHKRLIY